MSPIVASGAQIRLVSSASCVCVLCSEPHGNVSSLLFFTIRVHVPELCPKHGEYTWSHLTFLSLTSVSLSTQSFLVSWRYWEHRITSVCLLLSQGQPDSESRELSSSPRHAGLPYRSLSMAIPLPGCNDAPWGAQILLSTVPWELPLDLWMTTCKVQPLAIQPDTRGWY